MDEILSLMTDPAAWLALVTLTVMEVVLGIDNLLFISVLSNKLPEDSQSVARRIGIAGALVLRLVFLGTIVWIIKLTQPVFEILGLAFSWRDLILIAGGLFLLWKSTNEIHQIVDPEPGPEKFNPKIAATGIASVVVQILILDLVFSIDSILTAVGMTEPVPIMVIAVLITISIMLIAADPVANFIHSNPTIVMLVLAFLLLIGTMLIADGFGVHIPRGYIYAAMAFSAFVEALNMATRRRRQRKR